MPYFGVKKYGSLIRDLAIRFNQSDNIFDGAKLLQDYSDRHFKYLREAFIELYDKDSYPGNQKIVTHLFEKYVISDDVKTAFFSNFYSSDEDLEIEFVDKNFDYAYEMLRQIQLPLYAFKMTAHPEGYSEDHLKISMDSIIKYVIQDTEEAKITFRLASLSVAIKDRLLRYAQQQAEAAKQERTQKHKPGKQEHDQYKVPHIKNDVKREEPRYVIENEKALVVIFDYLIETTVIPKETDYPEFRNVVISANASLIKPIIKWKYNIALSFARKCLKGDSLAWTREVCTSLKIKPNKLTKNIDRESLWYEELVNRFKNSFN